MEIPTDPDMHMMFDRGLRGGVSMVANQYGRANNKDLPGYNENLPTSHIPYVDCNNLYGKAMWQYLPTGDLNGSPWRPHNPNFGQTLSSLKRKNRSMDISWKLTWNIHFTFILYMITTLLSQEI